MKAIRDCRGQYISKDRLAELFTPGKGITSEVVKSPIYMKELLAVEEFCRLARILIRYYLENLSQLPIATSKRMYR